MGAMDAPREREQRVQGEIACGSMVYAGSKQFAFTYMGEQDYTRRDGKQTQVRVWQAKCRRCRKPFSTLTPMYVTSPEASSHLNVRWCKPCREQRGEVKSRA